MINREELLQEANELIKQLEYKNKYEKLATYFPDTGKYNRTLYPKQIKFFDAGRDNKFRLFMGPNRSGKSLSSQYEFVHHLLGTYPSWWRGHRFDKPISAWAVGVNSDTVKNILQKGLLGEVGEFGSGMIPKAVIDFPTLVDAKKADTGISKFRVQHVSGGWSTVEFKAYESGRRAFEGTAIDLILLDEEPPLDIYTECVLRTMTTSGLIIMNFTPLLGATQVIHNFCNGPDWTEGEKGPGRFLVHLDEQNVPHLTPEMRATMEANIPEYQKDARLRGIPRLGAGKVFLTPWDSIVVEPFEIPAHWKRMYAIDFGWKTTAIVWAAIDPSSDTLYFTHEYYEHQKEPIFHAQAIITMNNIAGYKIPGVCDPAAGPNQSTGVSVRDTMEREFGLPMINANKDIDAGLFLMNHLLSVSKAKVFSTLPNFKKEYIMLTRNDKGDIIGEDHLMDVARYTCMTRTNAKTSVEVNVFTTSTYNSYRTPMAVDGIEDLGHYNGGNSDWQLA